MKSRIIKANHKMIIKILQNVNRLQQTEIRN